MALDHDPSAGAGLRSVTRVLDVLDALQDAPSGLPLRDVARASGMAKSTALRYLAALDERRYVERDPETGVYRLGLGVPSQSQIITRVRDTVRPALERVRDRFDETITFSVLEGERTVLVEHADSRQVIRLGAENGERGHLHSSANGKAIASTLPPARLERVIARHGLPARTQHTITDRDRLERELALVRERGYARTNEENNVGTCGIGVPLPGPRLHAAIGLSAPTMRFDDDMVEDVVAVLREEASHLAEALEAWRM